MDKEIKYFCRDCGAEQENLDRPNYCLGSLGGRHNWITQSKDISLEEEIIKYICKYCNIRHEVFISNNMQCTRLGGLHHFILSESAMDFANGLPTFICSCGVSTTRPESFSTGKCSINHNGHKFEMEDEKVNHPKHYQHPSGVEAITVCEHMSFNLGNAMKYIWRCDLKNGVEDLKKAAWYINREIEKREKK